MTIKYIKKADKTAASDEVETRQRVQDILKEIDTVIIDIRLDNGVNLSVPLPSGYSDIGAFHAKAGFYIFNDLVHLGFPSEKMCFMTGEKNSFTAFEAKCNEIYIPSVTGFEKNDAEYTKLRQWIKDQNSDYTVLRRGIIEGCNFIKSHIEKDEANIQFRDFIKTNDNRQPVIEILSTELTNYLDTLAQFLPLKQPNEENINQQYRLFLRALVHEWEESIDPNAIRAKYGYKDKNIHDIHTFAWLAKMTRNWTSHANLLEPLNPEIVAFLFLVNMRAMFNLPKGMQRYEQILLMAIPAIPINITDVNRHIKQSEENIDEILSSPQISEDKANKCFGEKINCIYRQNTGNPYAEDHDFQTFLFQYFWVNQKKFVSKLTGPSDDFLPVLARHIYQLSFP